MVSGPEATTQDLAKDEIQVDEDDPLISSDEALLPEDEEGLLTAEFAPSNSLGTFTPLIASPEKALPLPAEKSPQ